MTTPKEEQKGIDFIIGQYYAISLMKKLGFDYLPKASTPQWKVYEKNDMRVHLNYGEYRFAYVPERGGIGQLVGNFGVLR